MRQRASMLAAIEGISRPAYRVARELSQNSRTGLTVRFLAKKLELPAEEVEYLVDLHHSLLYTDLTKIRLVPEGFGAVKRVTEGLENLGDIPSLYRKVKQLPPHDFRVLEEQLGIDKPGAKKAVVDEVVKQHYEHPDSIVEYVASQSFSPVAREVFDILWQSKTGILPVAKIRATHGGSEQEIEQGLWELFRGLALCEMFRFDNEDRLLRFASLLTEIRSWRESNQKSGRRKVTLKARKSPPGTPEQRGIQLTTSTCKLVAAVAARNVRVRGDGELFREDRRRLLEIVSEDAEPSLATCLWAAEGIGWLARVDNELRSSDLEPLIDMHPLERHKLIFEWMMKTGNETESRRTISLLLEDLKPETWYRSKDFVHYALGTRDSQEQPVLKSQGAHYAFVSPSAAASADRSLARSIEETLFWFGVVNHAWDGNDLYFQFSDLGRLLLTDVEDESLLQQYEKGKAEIVVQPNFDIVVPTQDMDPLLTVPLDQFAERQSTGLATVYHLSKTTFTQALQEGHDGDAFVEYLLSHNRGDELPSNVMMTLDDWRGGLRRVRLRTIHILETDDALVMADLQHRRKFKKFLHRVDAQKMTVYKEITKADFARQLEKDGFIVE